MRYVVAPQINTGYYNRDVETIQPPWWKTVIQFTDAIIVMTQIQIGFLFLWTETIESIPPGKRGFHWRCNRTGSNGFFQFALFIAGQHCSQLDQHKQDHHNLNGDNTTNQIKGSL